MRAIHVPTRLFPPALLALLLVVGSRPVAAQRDSEPSGVRIGAQIAAGSVIAPVAFVAGGLAARGVARRARASEEAARNAAYIGAWTLAGLSTSVMPPLLVRGGNYPASLAGTVAGGAASAIMIWTGRRLFHEDARCGLICSTFGVVSVVLPATGATLLYNRSR